MEKQKVFCISICIGVVWSISVDISKSRVYGPGLNPVKVVLPVRYFFIHLVDDSGNELNDEPDGNLHVGVFGESFSGRPCRIWSNILNRKDGSFIVRYKVDSTCRKMVIDVRYDGFSFDGFPKEFNDVIISDNCNCPQNMQVWLKEMECKTHYRQIDYDLNKFESVNFSQVKKRILKRFNHPSSVSLCHYVVKNNEIFRQCFGDHVGFKIFMDNILLSLTRKIILPDFELFSNLGDWPLIPNNFELLPVFSWCGSESTHDILMPTYDLTESTLEAMARVQLDILSVQGNSGPKWEDKIEKAFWRGRDSCQERLNLIHLSKKFPDLINASITNFFFFNEEKYGPREKHVPFFQFFQYKYQINIDGTVAAYRLPYLLAGDSVVLKQDSFYLEHFYRDLNANVHFVPFKKDLSDLTEKIKWLKENDETAKKISRQAQKFVNENLMPKNLFCYYAVLFQNWASKLEMSPRVEPEMERVVQIDSDKSCICHKLPKDEF